MRVTHIAGGIGLGVALACGGGPSTGTNPGKRPNPDIEDLAEIARLNREYNVAEAMLKDRIRKNPGDHRAHRMLGDVNLTRGQDFAKKWKENLARAFDSYAEAVALAPDNCLYWGRVAGTVAMASQSDQTRIPRATLERLPLDLGWESCAGAPMLLIDTARLPEAQELDAVAKAEKDEWKRLALAAPWLGDAWARAPLDHVQWNEGPGPAELAPGRPFVILDPPMQARGQGHENGRPVTYVEKFLTNRLSEGRAIFVDRRFPERIAAEAVVEADACKYTSWKNDGPDGKATGTCTTNAFIRSESPLYNPSILRNAGTAHYHQPSIPLAIIPGEDIIEDSIQCVGGPVGRKLEYIPSCRVTYDKPQPVTRWLPRDKAYGAVDDDHAAQIMTAKGMQAVWGQELTERMIRGDVGIGMPYSLFLYSRPDLKGCLGRALHARHTFNGGELEWRCIFQEGDQNVAYVFLELQLVYIGPADEAPGVEITEEDE